MPASVRPPCLHGYDACMVIWIKGASWKIAGKSYVIPYFSTILFFCLVGTLYIGGGVRLSGIFGSVGLCRSGQREASLEEFDREVDGWLPLFA